MNKIFALIILIVAAIIYFYSSNNPKDSGCVQFLKKKGVMANHPKRRDMEFDILNDLSKAPIDLKSYYEKCKDRCDRVISKEGDKTFNQIPLNVQTFDGFCDRVPEWSSPETSYVFQRDDPRVSKKDVLCQRAQLSGLCYIHGPDMLQHYLVSINTNTSAPMIDISKLIRKSYNAKQLEDHIFNDKGGSSHTMLKSILEPGSIISSSKLPLIEQDLKEFGPILVSGFEVFEDFHKAELSSYHGNPVGKFLGLHAMIIIGSRTKENKNFYLLQNWWKQMQFVEVDEVYLKHCNPTLYYVETPQYKIPDKFATDSVRYAENENLDKPESMPYEGPLKGIY